MIRTRYRGPDRFIQIIIGVGAADGLSSGNSGVDVDGVDTVSVSFGALWS
jgi:hypothetical protein